MAGKQQENPLLFSANVSSPFDNISSAQLIPLRHEKSLLNEQDKSENLTQSLQPHLKEKLPYNANESLSSTIISTRSDQGSPTPPPPQAANKKGGSFLRRPTSKYVVPPEISSTASTNHSHPIKSPFMPSKPPPFPDSVPFKPASISSYDSHIPTNALATSVMNPGSQSPRDFSSGSPYSDSSASSQSAVIPTSFDSLATNPPLQGDSYHPVIHHWFYSEGKQNVWKPFSFTDSINLEEAYRQSTPKMIATDGGRYDVHLHERKRVPVYWEGEGGPVMRCSWFRRSYSEAQPVPYTEDVSQQLEEEYKDAMITGQWHRQVELPGGERVMLNSPYSMHHYPVQDPNYAPNITALSESQYPQTVRRGADDFEIKEGDAEMVDHLLFLIHGIGSVCDLSFRSVEECVDDFRAIGEDLLSSHFKTSIEQGKIGRVEILPISWHKALHGDQTGLDNKLKQITLRSIPKLREFTNDTLLDVFLYTSPKYCQHVMDTVASEMDRLLTLFKERTPSFDGAVSVGGHSLGSVILFDLLMHQNPDKVGIKEKENDSCEEKVKNHSLMSDEGDSFNGESRLSLTSQVNFEIGVAGTGQPAIVYPQLSFQPQAFFMMGSPVGMFITVRGIDILGPTFKLPTCDRVFNIFHPFDPVAYRIETLLDPSFCETRPVLIPHHKGRKRMHLELKDTIERVGSDIKNKIVESIQATWNKFYQLYAGGQNESVRAEVEQAVEEQMSRINPESQFHQNMENIPVGQLNRGHRVDYVLQEKPYESFTEYIFALQAHVTYWNSEDTMLMILKELYKINGIESDVQLQQHRRSSEIESPPPRTLQSLEFGNPVSSEDGESSPPSSSSFPSSAPVPLLSPPQSSSNMPPIVKDSELPRTLRGRPVFDPLKDAMPTGGVDPTAPPSLTGNLPPPPILPNLNVKFNRKKNT